MNKGLMIRNNKLRKNSIKRNIIKPEQENLCRFVKIRYQDIQKINGKFKRIVTKSASGLQIRNRLYLDNGHYKLINNKGTNITQIYDNIPEWASEALKDKYKKFHEQMEDDTDIDAFQNNISD